MYWQKQVGYLSECRKRFLGKVCFTYKMVKAHRKFGLKSKINQSKPKINQKYLCRDWGWKWVRTGKGKDKKNKGDSLTMSQG